MNKIMQKKERQMKILNSLDRLGYASRSQLQKLHDLKSNRNATRVLKDMEDMLNVMRLDENVYYLNKAGRELIGSDKKRTKTMQIDHFLMRNDVFIYYGCPKIWENEYNPVQDSKIIPDAFFKKDNNYYFLEVDNMQKMSNNRDKLKGYSELKERGVFQKKIGTFPTIIFYTTTHFRKNKLSSLANQYDLDLLIYTKEDLL